MVVRTPVRYVSHNGQRELAHMIYLGQEREYNKERREGKECRQEAEKRLAQQIELWGNIREEIRVTGALPISFETKTFPRCHHNGDVLIRTKETLEKMIEQGRQQGYFLVKRRSAVFFTGPKFHAFYPQTAEEASAQKEDPNLEFVYVGQDRHIVPETAIRLYIGREEKDTLVLNEFRKSPFVLPLEYWNAPETITVGKGSMLALPLPALQLLKKHIIDTKESKHPKHQEDYDRIELELRKRRAAQALKK